MLLLIGTVHDFDIREVLWLRPRDSGFARGLSAAVKAWMNRQDECTIGGISTPPAGQSSHGDVVTLARGTRAPGGRADQASRSRDQSSFPSLGTVCVVCFSRFCPTSSSSGRGGDQKLETWRASSPSFVRSLRRDQFFQLRDDREAGPTMCVDRREGHRASKSLWSKDYDLIWDLLASERAAARRHEVIVQCGLFGVEETLFCPVCFAPSSREISGVRTLGKSAKGAIHCLERGIVPVADW